MIRAYQLASLALLGTLYSGLTWADTAAGCSDPQRGATISTEHQITLNGKVISYTATVGFLDVVVDPSLFAQSFPAAPASTTIAKGCIFYTSYIVHTPAGSAQRPLTFAFNGGPGSASLWLHMGALGPKVVNEGTDGTDAPLPFQLQDNPDSPLDLTDIVMIDPMSTGFSFPDPSSKADQFFGAYNDAESVATFIRTYMDNFKREDSPLYVTGESYGGMRGSLVAQILQLPLYLPLKGLILVSPCLSSTIDNFGEDDNDVPYYTFFPTYASTAWYQKRIAAKYQGMDVADVFEAARQFAFGPYRDALAMGNTLTPDQPQFQAIAQELSDFTGIPAAEIAKHDLRIRDVDFFGMELEDKDEVVGRFDTRFVGRKLTTQNGSNATDPSDAATGFPFVSAVNSYLRNDLGFTTASPYVDSANPSAWPFNSDSSEFVATHNLSQAFADNPNLQVFVASGYYDLACPMGTVEYEKTRLDPESNGAGRMTIHPYPSGHMVYINPAARSALKSDLSSFYIGTLAGIALP